MGILEAFASLGRDINKSKGRSASPETTQGVSGELLPELELDMKNEDLSALTQTWLGAWDKSELKGEWEKACDDNEKYYKGKHYEKPGLDKTRPVVDNAIFEALETWLPEMTRKNPEPMVSVSQRDDESDANLAYAAAVQKELAQLADVLKLRLKLKRATRHWALYLLGVAKLGWDMDRDIPTVKIVRARKMILDPGATIDEEGYSGGHIGEYRELEAGTLVSTLDHIGGEAGASDVVKKLVKEKMGTEVKFVEWWTPEYMCWTLGKDVLLKKKNPHWNYDRQVPLAQPALPTAAAGSPAIPDASALSAPAAAPGAAGAPPEAPDEAVEAGEAPGEPKEATEGRQEGAEEAGDTGEGQTEPEQPTQAVPGVNHFPNPRMPYVFLSVFNLGTQPVDDTSLIGQNLSNQDKLNKRNRQIDKAVDSSNNGMVVSRERSGLSDSQIKGVSEALRRGGTVVIPSGAPRDAVDRMTAPPLPPDVYRDLQDTRSRLADIFGSRGLTPSGLGSNRTVRGMVFEHQVAADRISGVTEYLEQFADDIFNWLVQLLYVYDDRIPEIPDKPRVVVSIKEGSLLPKDSTTIANQAIELASKGKMSLVDLYKKLDYPNPEELAVNTWLEANAPDVLYQDDPRVAAAMQRIRAAQAQQPKPPSESINYKDLTPDAKAQLLAKAGLDAHPEGIAAHDAHAAARDAALSGQGTGEPDENEPA